MPRIVPMTLAILPAMRETSSIGLSADGTLPFADSARASAAMRALVAITRSTALTKARQAASASRRPASGFLLLEQQLLRVDPILLALLLGRFTLVAFAQANLGVDPAELGLVAQQPRP